MNNLLPECEYLVAGAKTDEKIEEAIVLLQALKEAAIEMKGLDEEVSNLTVEDTEFEKNEREAYEFLIKTRKMEGKLCAFVENANEFKPQARFGIPTQGVGVKLLKIKINSFEVNGKSFIEAFDAMVHVRIDISNIEKFTYLRGFLSGSALQTIEGMPLTSDNYIIAKDLLEKRYGNPQLIVSCHMNALLKLDKIVSANAKELRNLHDKVEMNIRALNTTGAIPEHFGALLIPIVLEKLRNIVRLQISRKLGTDNWSIKDFMASINDEVSARENFKYLKNNESLDNYEETKTRLVHTSLAVIQKVCVFCGNKSHYSNKCDIATEVNLRKQKLRELIYCFECLRGNHIARNCCQKVFYYRCKAQNRHNTAICEKEWQSSGILVTGSDKSILLQTANGYITDKKEKKLEEINILLDNCSQQTFISERIVKRLGLNPVKEIDRKINAFGTDKGKGMCLKEFEIVIKPMDESSSIYINALAIPVICAPICRRYLNVKLAKEQNEFLQALKLADNGDGF